MNRRAGSTQIARNGRPFFLSFAGLSTGAVLFVSVALTCWPLFFIDKFSYEHAWVSAHFATMARGFLDYGFIELGLVPVQNAGPLTDQPDHYINWPPFFSIFLAGVFAALGTAGVLAVHATATVLVLAQAALIGIWAKRVFSPLAAVVAIVVFLNMPVIAKFSHAGLHVHLAFLLTLVAIFFFDHAARHVIAGRRYVAWGSICFALACFTSWEPILIVPGLVMYWWVERCWRRVWLIVIYALSGITAFVTTLLLYLLQVPNVITMLVDRALFRGGLSHYTASTVRTLHAIEDSPLAMRDLGPADMIAGYLRTIFLLHLPQIGVIGGLSLITVIVLGARRRGGFGPSQGPALVLAPLLSMGVLWVMVMPQHFFIHNYQTLLFALPAALAAGFLAEAKRNSLVTVSVPAPASHRPKAFLIVVAAITIVARLGVDVQKYRWHGAYDEYVAIGRALNQSVPENAVVAVPWNTMIPTYYSNRHLLRGVVDFETYTIYAEEIGNLCAGCPVFLVIPADDDLPSPGAHRTVWQDERWRLVAMTDAGPGASVPDQDRP